MKKDKTVTAVTLVFFAITMLILNFVTPWYTDDWHLMYVFHDMLPVGNDRRIENFSDIFYSLGQYWLGHGGRLLPHFIVFTLLMFDKWVFNILNTVIFLLFGLLVCGLVKRFTDCKNAFLLPITYFAVIIVMPTFGANALWLSGSANYIWAMMLNLFCIKYFLDNISTDSKLKLIPLYLLTFLAAATNEITGGMLLILYFLYWLRHERKFKMRYLLLVLFTVAAMLTVILAPGNYNRAERFTGAKGISLTETPPLIGSYLNLIINRYERWYVLAFPIIVFLIQWHKKEKPLKSYEFYDFIVAGFAGLAALAFSGTYIKRSAFSPFAYLIIAFLCSLIYLFRFLKAYDKNYIRISLTFLKKLWIVETVYWILRSAKGVIHSVEAEEMIISCTEVVLVVLLMAAICALLRKFPEDKVFVIRLNRLPGFLKKHFKKIAAVATSACAVFLIVNIYLYDVYDDSELKQAYKAMEDYSEYRTDNNIVTLSNDFSAEKHSSIFTVNWVPKFRETYEVSWMAIYYDLDIDYSTADGKIILELHHGYIPEDLTKKYLT